MTMDILKRLLDLFKLIPDYVFLVFTVLCIVYCAIRQFIDSKKHSKSRHLLHHLRREALSIGYDEDMWALLPQGQISEASFTRQISENITLHLYGQHSISFGFELSAHIYKDFEPEWFGRRMLKDVNAQSLKAETLLMIDDLIFAGRLSADDLWGLKNYIARRDLG